MNELSVPCCYRKDGIFCWGGYLHYSVEPHDPVMVVIDHDKVKAICPVCAGKAVLPTEEGKKILRFLEVFAS